MTRRGSFDILQPGTLPRTRKEDLSHDPRGEGTRPPAVCHAARPRAAERDRGVPATWALAHPVLPLAPTVSALWRRWAQAPAAVSGAADAAGLGGGRGRRPGLRAPVADPRPRPHRPATDPSRRADCPPERLGGVCHPQAARPEL